jgi:hypothetical protein
MPELSDLPEPLQKMYRQNFAEGLHNEKINISGSVLWQEAVLLRNIVLDNKLTATSEIGLACGASATAICDAHSNLGMGGVHYSFDPYQKELYQNAGLKTVEASQLEAYHKFFTKPSYVGIVTELIEKGIMLDLAFVDGWHTFDYKLTDVFLLDKILKSGGYLALHDSHWPSTLKVIRYLSKYRHYDYLPHLRVKDRKFTTPKYFFLKRLINSPSNMFSTFYLRNYFSISSGLTIFKKRDNFEPNYDFHSSF